jgi:hypothetical protein
LENVVDFPQERLGPADVGQGEMDADQFDPGPAGRAQAAFPVGDLSAQRPSRIGAPVIGRPPPSAASRSDRSGCPRTNPMIATAMAAPSRKD